MHSIIWATPAYCISLSHRVQCLCKWQKRWLQNEQVHGTLCRRGVKERETGRKESHFHSSSTLNYSIMAEGTCFFFFFWQFLPAHHQINKWLAQPARKKVPSQGYYTVTLCWCHTPISSINTFITVVCHCSMYWSHSEGIVHRGYSRNATHTQEL